MLETILHLISPLVVLGIMGLGLSLLLGGPTLGKRYSAWVKKNTLAGIRYLLWLPFRLTGELFFPPKPKKKKKKAKK